MESMWDEGLQVVLIYEGAVTAQTCDVIAADDAAFARSRCLIVFRDMTKLVWTINSTDGRRGSITVDTTTMMLPTEATVIRIHNNGGSIQITPYQRMLPPLTMGDASRTLEQWMARDAEFAPFAAMFRSQ